MAQGRHFCPVFFRSKSIPSFPDSSLYIPHRPPCFHFLLSHISPFPSPPDAGRIKVLFLDRSSRIFQLIQLSENGGYWWLSIIRVLWPLISGFCLGARKISTTTTTIRNSVSADQLGESILRTATLEWHLKQCGQFPKHH